MACVACLYTLQYGSLRTTAMCYRLRPRHARRMFKQGHHSHGMTHGHARSALCFQGARSLPPTVQSCARSRDRSETRVLASGRHAGRTQRDRHTHTHAHTSTSNPVSICGCTSRPHRVPCLFCVAPSSLLRNGDSQAARGGRHPEGVDACERQERKGDQAQREEAVRDGETRGGDPRAGTAQPRGGEGRRE